MPDASIKALLFDLGDVMIGLDFDRAYRAAAELSPYSPEEIRELVRQADLANPYERGEISSNVFYRRFCEAVEIDIPFDRFRLLWGDMFERKPLLPEDFFAALAENYRLVLLSNTNELHFEFIRARYPLLTHFHEFVLSYEVGVIKPGKEIYTEAVQRAGCEPCECFFTDDKLVNVKAGERLGIQAVVFESPEHLRQNLLERGVYWNSAQPRINR